MLKKKILVVELKKGRASDHLTIHSPAAGIVIYKNAQEGLYVKTGTKIYTIADLSSVWIQLDAYESDLQWLHEGDTATLSPVVSGEELIALQKLVRAMPVADRILAQAVAMASATSRSVTKFRSTSSSPRWRSR